jgi:hypothetical protein
MNMLNLLGCIMENESKPISVTDSMGREIFWEDIGRPDDGKKQ